MLPRTHGKVWKVINVAVGARFSLQVHGALYLGYITGFNTAPSASKGRNCPTVFMPTLASIPRDLEACRH